MRQRVLITNSDKFGRVTNKWFVKIGKKSRVFGQSEWAESGIAWVNSMLGAQK